MMTMAPRPYVSRPAVINDIWHEQLAVACGARGLSGAEEPTPEGWSEWLGRMLTRRQRDRAELADLRAQVARLEREVADARAAVSPVAVAPPPPEVAAAQPRFRGRVTLRAELTWFARSRGEFTYAEALATLLASGSIAGQSGKRRLTRALNQLVEAGTVERADRGQYRVREEGCDE